MIQIFLYLCTVVLPLGRTAVFYWNESVFSLIRLSEHGQFTNDCTGIRKSSLPIEYALPNRWGLVFSILQSGSPCPTQRMLAD